MPAWLFRSKLARAPVFLRGRGPRGGRRWPAHIPRVPRRAAAHCHCTHCNARLNARFHPSRPLVSTLAHRGRGHAHRTRNKQVSSKQTRGRLPPNNNAGCRRQTVHLIANAELSSHYQHSINNEPFVPFVNHSTCPSLCSLAWSLSTSACRRCLSRRSCPSFQVLSACDSIFFEA